MFAALITEVVYQPPYWLHAALWLPLIANRDPCSAAVDQGAVDCVAISSQGGEGRLERRGEVRASAAQAPLDCPRRDDVRVGRHCRSCGLGVWQLDRKVWKENRSRDLNPRLSSAHRRFAAAFELAAASSRWRGISPCGFPGRSLSMARRLLSTRLVRPCVPDVKGPGYSVFAPARLAGGSIVLVNRGFVPPERKDPSQRSEGTPHGVVDVVGVMRGPRPARGPSRQPMNQRKMSGICVIQKRSLISRNGQLRRRFISMRKSRCRPVAGQSRASRRRLPDDHLQYAITSASGLALALAGAYLVWLARRLVGKR